MSCIRFVQSAGCYLRCRKYLSEVQLFRILNRIFRYLDILLLQTSLPELSEGLKTASTVSLVYADVFLGLFLILSWGHRRNRVGKVDRLPGEPRIKGRKIQKNPNQNERKETHFSWQSIELKYLKNHVIYDRFPTVV